MRFKRTMLLRLPHGLLLIAGLLAYSPFAWSQISLVQVTACASPATTCTIPATGSGHLIVVGWSSTFGSTPSITSITDNAGNTYFEAGNARSVNSSSDKGDIWYAYNSNAGATTLLIFSAGSLSAQALPVPAPYQDLYNTLSTQIASLGEPSCLIEQIQLPLLQRVLLYAGLNVARPLSNRNIDIQMVYYL